MDWQEPKIDWLDSNLPTLSDFDRIERNIQHLKDTL